MAKIMMTVGDLFGVLGVPPALGRSFENKESWNDVPRVAILSHGLWKSRFAGDPAILGRKLTLNGAAVTVVGVMPAGFRFAFEDVDLWTTAGWRPEYRTAVSFRRAHGLRAIGRLAPGATSAGPSELSHRRTPREAVPDTNTLMGARPGRSTNTSGDTKKLLLLHAAVALVLLIACANAAHLLHLARSAAPPRRWPYAAVSARRGDGLLRQAFLESAPRGGGRHVRALVARFGIPALLKSVPLASPVSVRSPWTCRFCSSRPRWP
jgi:hypothetical protein